MVSRLTSLETSVNALVQQFKTLSKELTEVSPVSERIDQFEAMMTRQRADLSKIIDAVEKAAVKREQDIQKLYLAEMEEIRKSIFEVSKSVNTDEIYKKLRDRTHEEQRLTTMVQDMRSSVDVVASQNKDLLQAQKAFEDGRRQDAKRVADLYGEIAAVRKRAEDARDKASVHADAIRNVERRIGELLETETNRQDTQTTFLAQQSMAHVERDRTWKVWQEKFDRFTASAEKMETQIVALDDFDPGRQAGARILHRPQPEVGAPHCRSRRDAEAGRRPHPPGMGGVQGRRAKALDRSHAFDGRNDARFPQGA